MAKGLLFSMEKTHMAMKKQGKNTQIIKDSIPDHVIEDILLKLPPKSLLRFNCLSKSWKDTICSSFFCRVYLHKNKTNPPLIVSRNREFMSKIGINNEASHINVLLVEKLKILPEHTARQYDVMFESGCDDILCIRTNAEFIFKERTYPQNIDLVLWNPSIRKHKILTVPRIEHAEERFGIGYDPSIDDYKIIKFLRKVDNSNDPAYCKVELYTLKSNQWRRLSYDLAYVINIWSRPVSVKGVMYWLAELEGKQAIVCFDLANKTFSTVELPPKAHQRISGLMELEDKLACFCETDSFSGYDCFDVWAMEDETWIILINISISYKFVNVPISYRVGYRSVVYGLADVDPTLKTNVIKLNLLSAINILFQPFICCSASLISLD